MVQVVAIVFATKTTVAQPAHTASLPLLLARQCSVNHGDQIWHTGTSHVKCISDKTEANI